ncbi:LTA synthase family protein [Bacillaceae bacterium]
MKLVWRLCAAYGDLAAFILFLLSKIILFAKFAGLAYDDRLALVSLGSVLLIASWTHFFAKWKRRFVTLWIVNFFVSFVIFADLVYFRYFGDFITIPVLLQARQVEDIGSSITKLVEAKDLLFFLDLLAVLPLWIIAWRKKRGPAASSASLQQRAILSALTFAAGAYLVYHPVNEYVTKHGKNLFVNNWSNVSIYNVIGHLGFHVFDVKRYLEENVFREKELTPEERKEAQAFFANNRRLLREKTPFFNAARGKNVLIVQLESFQSYVIGKKINGREITPHLNRLKEETMYFSRFYHQVGQGRTSDAEFLANASLYPLPSGSVFVRYPGNEYDALPKILREHGYYTAAFHAYEKSFWNRYVMYKNFQFDDFYGKGDFAPGENVGPFAALGDKGLFRQTVAILKGKREEAKKPFYGFVVALSSHHPYTGIPGKYQTLDLGPYAGTMFGNYLQALHYVDEAVGELVSLLKKEGLWDDTVLVIYGDHDSGIPLDAGMAAYVGMEWDELSQAQSAQGVPFFLHIPGRPERGEFPYTTGMIDIAPTLLHLLGIPPDRYAHMGGNMLRLKDHLVAFRYGSFAFADRFYKASKDGVFGNGSCYDARTGKKVDTSECAHLFQTAQNRLRLSDRVIYGDLLREALF